MNRLVSVICILTFAFSLPAQAYVGPGVGVTLIGWFVGGFLTIAAVLWAALLWPIKNILARCRRGRKELPDAQPDDIGNSGT